MKFTIRDIKLRTKVEIRSYTERNNPEVHMKDKSKILTGEVGFDVFTEMKGLINPTNRMNLNVEDLPQKLRNEMQSVFESLEEYVVSQSNDTLEVNDMYWDNKPREDENLYLIKETIYG